MVQNHKGWATYGDIGQVDEDGFLYLTDRRVQHDHLRWGEHLPQEAENGTPAPIPTSTTWPSWECPTTRWVSGSRPSFELSEKSERTDTKRVELINYCRDHLAHYKCPKEVDFVDKLPASGRQASLGETETAQSVVGRSIPSRQLPGNRPPPRPSG